MADNDKNNMSGDSRVPKSTKGLEGSVSLEDLKKYHLIDTGDENTPTNNTVSDEQASNEEPKQAEENPTPVAADHLQAEESNDHLSEAKHDAPVDDDKFEPTPVPPVTPKESIEDSKAEPDQKQADSSNDQEDVKPWEKSFDSDTDEEGHVSRAVTKEKQRGNHTLVVTLVVALIVIMFTPVIINAVRGSGSGDLDSSQAESSVENKDKSTKKKAAKKSTKKKSAKKDSTKKNSAKKKTTTNKDSNSDSNANNSNTASDSTSANSATADSSNSQTADNTQQQTQESQQSQQSQQSDQQASTGTTTNDSSTTSTDSNSSSASYYTVKAGDNWFRIAYNNNLTTAQLKSMNGNVGTLTPGTTLRVK